MTFPRKTAVSDPSVSRFFDSLDGQGVVSAQAVYACHRDISEFDAFMDGRGRSAMAATPRDIQAYVLKIQGLPGAALRLRSVRMYFRFLVRQGAISADPAAHATVPGSLPHFSLFEHRAIKVPLALFGIFVLTEIGQFPMLPAVGLAVAGWILMLLALPVNESSRSV